MTVVRCDFRLAQFFKMSWSPGSSLLTLSIKLPCSKQSYLTGDVCGSTGKNSNFVCCAVLKIFFRKLDK